MYFSSQDYGDYEHNPRPIVKKLHQPKTLCRCENPITVDFSFTNLDADSATWAKQKKRKERASQL